MPASSRRALLVHGLGSNGALMWRYGVRPSPITAGTRPRSICAGTAPRRERWTTESTRTPPTWPRPRPHARAVGPRHRPLARRCGVDGRGRRRTPSGRAGSSSSTPRSTCPGRPADRAREPERSFDDPTVAAVRAEHPHWHPLDIELKAASAGRRADTPSSRRAPRTSSGTSDPTPRRSPSRRMSSAPTLPSTRSSPGDLAHEVRRKPAHHDVGHHRRRSLAAPRRPRHDGRVSGRRWGADRDIRRHARY